jgi:hypothetical protein
MPASVRLRHPDTREMREALTVAELDALEAAGFVVVSADALEREAAAAAPARKPKPKPRRQKATA